jgi:hypothetical protein
LVSFTSITEFPSKVVSKYPRPAAANCHSGA